MPRGACPRWREVDRVMRSTPNLVAVTLRRVLPCRISLRIGTGDCRPSTIRKTVTRSLLNVAVDIRELGGLF